MALYHLFTRSTARQPGRLWKILNYFYLSLSPGLSKKSAYRLNVTLRASAIRTVITKKIFRSHKPYILSQKVFKVAPVSKVTLNTYQHALKPSLTQYKRKVAFTWNVFESELYGVGNFSTPNPLQNFLTDSDPKFCNNTQLWNTPIQKYTLTKNSK